MARKQYDHSIVEKVFKTSLAAYMMNTFAWAIGTLVDGAIIGNFLGVDSVAAYGMIWPMTLVFGLIGAILAGGSRNIYTHLAGHGKTREANQIFTIACAMAFGISVLLMLLTLVDANPLAMMLGANGANAHLRPLIRLYISGYVLALPFDSVAKVLSSYMGMDSDHQRVIYATLAMTIVDIIGDLIAVFVFDGGMFAIGFATAIGNLVYCLVLSTHFLRPKRMLRFVFDGIQKPLKNGYDIIKNGAPAGITRIASAISGITINHILAAYATSNHLAAYSVVKSLSSLFGATYFGVADTVWVLSSIYYGEEDQKALYDLQRTAQTYGLRITCLIALILLLFPRFFAGIYIGYHNTEALVMATEVVWMFAVSVPLYLLAYMFDDYLMGIGRLRAASIYSFFLECGEMISVVFIMVQIFGGRGAWLALPISLIIMILCAWIYIVRYGEGQHFNDKRLLVDENFGVRAGEELAITADTMLEVIGMARLAGLFCQENGIDDRKANVLSLCIEEIGQNIIEHGFNDGKPHAIDIRILVKKGELILRIRDDCILFNLLEQYELSKQLNDPTKNIGTRIVVNMSKDVLYLSTMGTNNLIIRI